MGRKHMFALVGKGGARAGIQACCRSTTHCARRLSGSWRMDMRLRLQAEARSAATMRIGIIAALPARVSALVTAGGSGGNAHVAKWRCRLHQMATAVVGMCWDGRERAWNLAVQAAMAAMHGDAVALGGLAGACDPAMTGG